MTERAGARICNLYVLVPRFSNLQGRHAATTFRHTTSVAPVVSGQECTCDVKKRKPDVRRGLKRTSKKENQGKPRETNHHWGTKGNWTKGTLHYDFIIGQL